MRVDIISYPSDPMAFVTSKQFYGDLGGLTGADAKCQAAADDGKGGAEAVGRRSYLMHRPMLNLVLVLLARFTIAPAKFWQSPLKNSGVQNWEGTFFRNGI